MIVFKTYFMEAAPSTKPALEGQYHQTFPTPGRLLIGVLYCCRKNDWYSALQVSTPLPFHPPFLQKVNHYFAEELKRGIIIPTNQNGRAEAAFSLSHYRSGSHVGKYRLQKFLKKSSSITSTSEVILQIVAPDCLKSYQYFGSRKKFFVPKGRKF